MSRIYGIDLGTTNSLIGTNEGIIGSMVPSIASLEDKRAGARYREDLTAVRSFKVNMSMGTEGKESIAASSLVLKELVRQAAEAGHKVERVAISVPAYFSDNQRQATIEAARSIGLKVEGLINEPTAAAMKYSKNQKSINLVFDLGGGTFDVSAIDSRFGNFDVQATDGLTIGGDDFDKALMKHVMKSCRFKVHRMDKQSMTHLKILCEDAKILMQKNRKDVIIDLSDFSNITEEKVYVLTPGTYVTIMKAVFGECISKTKQVVAESIDFGDTYKLLLVGGSTRDPFLQEWIEESIGKKPEPLTYNPDMLVAEGACFYAHLLETGEAEFMVSDVTKAMGIVLRDGTVQIMIPKNSKIPISATTMVTNQTRTSGLSLTLCQGDSRLAVNNEIIGTMPYDFDEEKEPGRANVKVTVEVNMNGLITLRAKELLKEERVITIDRRDI